MIWYVSLNQRFHLINGARLAFSPKSQDAGGSPAQTAPASMPPPGKRHPAALTRRIRIRISPVRVKRRQKTPQGSRPKRAGRSWPCLMDMEPAPWQRMRQEHCNSILHDHKQYRNSTSSSNQTRKVATSMLTTFVSERNLEISI